jgi:hypothetical protein
MYLAAAKIALDIIWSSGDRFSNVIVNLGPFHTECSLLGALGKMMSGSGFEDVIIQENVCARGSLNQVMSGKHFNRALTVHELMLSALEQLLFQ